MPHSTPLIATLVGSLVLAFLLGAVAQRLRLPPLAGYLVAGVLAGPYTPGFVADTAIAQELAEIGVILLMFGVGLHLSLKDLLSVRAIALPGAVAQMTVATLLGMALAAALGWPVAEGFVFGLALSVASTVVLLRALQERRLLESERGRIAVGWLIVEDLAMVLALVLLPAVAGVPADDAPGAPRIVPEPGALALAVVVTLAEVAAFVALMLVVGRRVIPRTLQRVAATGSRELFRLAVLALALGVAFGSAYLFGVSFALGAFFAGLVLGEGTLSHQAAEESLPFRDAFAVLFFVSVGMLFDPMVLLREPLVVLGAFLVVVLGKSIAALAIVLAFRKPLSLALTIAVSLAQIGEFSFILVAVGTQLELLSGPARDAILAAALLSILVNPLLFAALDRAAPWLRKREGDPAPVAPRGLRPSTQRGHVVLVGYGRVGSRIGAELLRRRTPFLVVEEREEVAAKFVPPGVEVLIGNPAAAEVAQAANLAHAHALVLAIPRVLEAAQMTRHARAANAGLRIVARAHSDDEVAHLLREGADQVVMGEHEIARGMLGRLPAVLEGETFFPTW